MTPVGWDLFIAQGAMRAKPEMKPWACRGVVPTALIMHLNFDAVALYWPSNTVLMCKIFFIFASTNPFLINPEREQVQSR